MSGWAPPPTPGPVVGWEVPSEPQGLGVRDSIGAGWRVLRSHPIPLVATAAIPQIVGSLLTLASLLIVAQAFGRMIEFFSGIDWSRYVDNQVALQREMEAAFLPPPELAVISSVASALTLTVGLIGLALVTAATLPAIDGRRPTVGAAYRAVAAHAGALIVPAVVLGVALILVGTPLTLVGLAQGPIPVGEETRAQQALTAVLGLVGFALTIAALVLAIRWSLAIPAILAEDLGLRRGLARSAELTAGIRVRIFVILLVFAIVVGIVLGAIALVSGLVVGVATFSIVGGIVGYMVATMISGFFWLPLVAAILSHIYRLRAGAAEAVVAAAGADESGPDEAVVPDATPSG